MRTESAFAVLITGLCSRLASRSFTRIIGCLLCLLPLAGIAQVTVSGKVVNEDGQPLEAASVFLKGTKTGVVASTEGAFTISLPGNAGKLVVSRQGYTTREVAVTAQSKQLVITLTAAKGSMDEVVVVGYGTRKKSDLTGSVSGVNSEQLNRTKQTDLLNSLQGKIAGVSILQQSGELGSGFNIKIRGANSISGSAAPLFVIDGIPIDVNSNEVAGSTLTSSTTPNPLAGLNPQDIESIEVLKDASATAIYGSRGANGVVLITTKSGKVGRSTVEYDVNLRFNELSKKIKVLNAQEYHDYRVSKAGAADPLANQMDTTGDGIVDLLAHDWQDELYRNTVSHSHTLTISSGNKTTQFSSGLNYVDDQGLVNNSRSRRYGARLRVEHAVSDRLKVGFNLNASDNILEGNTASGGAFKGITRRILFSRPVDLYTSADASDGYDTYVSPASDLEKSYLNSNSVRLLGNVNGNYKINKNLGFNVIFGGGTTSSKGKEFYSSETFGGVLTKGAATVQNINSYNWTNTNQLTYNKEFRKGTSLNLIGVFELSSYGYETSGMAASNFADQSTGVDDISKGSVINSIATYKFINNRVSYLTRANVNLLDRFLITLSFRADGSDKFGANNKFGYFPSAAVAWKLTNERFLSKSRVINELKLRASYGITGNEKITPFNYLALLENAYYPSAGAPLLGLAPGNPGNPDLKWEENRSYNAGLDLTLLDQRISFTADVYTRQVRNMLIKAQLPTQGGFYSQFKNLGRVDNSGVELSLTTHNIRKKDITWDLDFNLTYNTSVIKSLGGATQQPVTVAGDINDLGMLIVGQPFGTGYGYVKEGVYQLADFDTTGGIYTLKPGIPAFAGGTVQPGSYRFKDITGPNGKPDGIIDSYDQQVISQSQPKFTGGLSSNLRVKGFEFSFFLQGVADRQILNVVKLDLTGFKANKNLGADFYYNRWTPTNPTNDYGTYSDQNATAQQSSSFYVEDGSYLRLQSVTLAYNLPAKWRFKGLSKLRFYVTGNNLAVWTNYSGYDPEVAYKSDLLSGVDALAFPHTKTYIVGLTASF